MDVSEKCTPDFERLLSEAGLSDREAEALRTVAQGLTAEEAGQLMGVTPSTVGTYRQRGYKKLGVSTRSEFLSIPQARAEAASAARNADAANTANNAPMPDRPSAATPCGEKRANAARRVAHSDCMLNGCICHATTFASTFLRGQTLPRFPLWNHLHRLWRTPECDWHARGRSSL